MKLSEMYSTYSRTNRCPHCQKFLWYTREFVNGVELNPLALTHSKHPAAVAQCPKCQQQWPVYRRDMEIRVLEDRRESLPAWTEEFTLDNLHGRTSLRRTKGISREWTHTIELETTASRSTESGVQLGNDLVQISEVATNAISSTYRAAKTETQTFTESLEFDVPPGMSRRVVLTFKRVWQSGRLELVSAENVTTVPFRIVVGLELDVAQHDRVS